MARSFSGRAYISAAIGRERHVTKARGSEAQRTTWKALPTRSFTQAPCLQSAHLRRRLSVPATGPSASCSSLRWPLRSYALLRWPTTTTPTRIQTRTPTPTII
ncbi:hypothetical protein V5799_026046 [Amblyomma americanum]|uniref:Uncharacterized protein n=1 Tax=Amblyomma americanum TaxID=6943 RepID=A0AAQ4DJP2_AMBAM